MTPSKWQFLLKKSRASAHITLPQQKGRIQYGYIVWYQRSIVANLITNVLVPNTTPTIIIADSGAFSHYIGTDCPCINKTILQMESKPLSQTAPLSNPIQPNSWIRLYTSGHWSPQPCTTSVHLWHIWQKIANLPWSLLWCRLHYLAHPHLCCPNSRPKIHKNRQMWP